MSTIETSSLEQIKIKALNEAAAALQALAKIKTDDESIRKQRIEAFNSRLAALKELLSITEDVDAYAAIFKQVIAQGGHYQDPKSNAFKQFYLTIFVDKVENVSDSALSNILNNIKEARASCQEFLDEDIAAFGDALQTLDSAVSTLELSSKPLGSVILSESEIAVLCSRVEEGAIPAAKKVVYERDESKAAISNYPIFLHSYEGKMGAKISKPNRPNIVLERNISEISPENDAFFVWVFAENEADDVKIQIDSEDAHKFRDLLWPDSEDGLLPVTGVDQELFDIIDNSYRMEKFYIEGSEHQDIVTLKTTQERLMSTLGCLGLPDEDSDCFRLAHQRYQQENDADQNYLPHLYGLGRAIPETFYANGEPTYLVGKRLEPLAKIGRNLLDVNVSPEDQYQLAIKKGDVVNFEKLVEGCSNRSSPDYYSLFDAAKLAVRNNQLAILKGVIQKEKIEAQSLGRQPMNELAGGDGLNPTLLFNALFPEEPNVEIIAYLMEEKADLFVRNRLKKTVLELAFEKDNPEAILNAILDGLEKRFDLEEDKYAKKHINALRKEIKKGAVKKENVNEKFFHLMHALEPEQRLNYLRALTKKRIDGFNRPTEHIAGLNEATDEKASLKLKKINTYNLIDKILSGEDDYHPVVEGGKTASKSRNIEIGGKKPSAMSPSERLNSVSNLLNSEDNKDFSEHRNKKAIKAISMAKEAFFDFVKILFGERFLQNRTSAQPLSQSEVYKRTFNATWPRSTVEKQNQMSVHETSTVKLYTSSKEVTQAAIKQGVFSNHAEEIQSKISDNAAKKVILEAAKTVHGFALRSRS